MKKKFSGMRPVMFYQPGLEEYSNDLVKGRRLRIFYPNGKVEWAALGYISSCGEDAQYWFDNGPCFLQKQSIELDGRIRWVDFMPNDMEHALRLAKEYDKSKGFPKMIFLGEL